MIPLDTTLSIYTALANIITIDLINGLFELSAGFFVLNHCRVLRQHKQVRGILI